MKSELKRFLGNNSGATAIEYGLIAAMVSIVIVSVAGTLGAKIEALYAQVAQAVPVEPSPPAK